MKEPDTPLFSRFWDKDYKTSQRYFTFSFFHLVKYVQVTITTVYEAFNGYVDNDDSIDVSHDILISTSTSRLIPRTLASLWLLQTAIEWVGCWNQEAINRTSIYQTFSAKEINSKSAQTELTTNPDPDFLKYMQIARQVKNRFVLLLLACMIRDMNNDIDDATSVLA